MKIYSSMSLHYHRILIRHCLSSLITSRFVGIDTLPYITTIVTWYVWIFWHYYSLSASELVRAIPLFSGFICIDHHVRIFRKYLLSECLDSSELLHYYLEPLNFLIMSAFLGIIILSVHLDSLHYLQYNMS